MKRIINYDIKDIENISVEKFLKSKRYTSNVIKQLKKIKESVLLDGVWAYMKDDMTKHNTLTIKVIEDSNSENIVAKKQDINIIYEDEDIVVVNKNSNTPIHPSLNNYDNTLANALMYYYNEKGEKFIYRCINRLDKDTSGLTIIAKNMISAGVLYDDMKNRNIKRTYLALVYDNGDLKEKDTLDYNIIRTDDSLIKREVSKDGVKAITHYEIVRRYGGYSLIKLRLDTGRTHQIRVHLSHIGHPLLGDDLYGADKILIKNNNDIFIDRVCLHSYSLEFNHPISNEYIELKANLPEDMDRWL